MSQTPQGEPPRFDFKRGIPTALTTASLGKLAADAAKPTESLAVRDTRARDARGIPDVDYKGRAYSLEQKQRVAELGADKVKGLVLEEGESGLAAEVRHNLDLTRYKDSGLEFQDQNGEYWDVVSPPSYSKDGTLIFNVNTALRAINRHFLKGNVILDFGQLTRPDAEKLKEAVEAISEADRRGQKIVFVREGE